MPCLPIQGTGVSVICEMSTTGPEKYGEHNILLDVNATNYTLSQSTNCQEVIRAASPIPAMKAIQNDTEIVSYHSAMLSDGIALVKFLKWLMPAVAAGGQTEISLDEKLTGLQVPSNLCSGGISFDTTGGA